LSIIDLAGEATARTASRYFAAFGYSVIPADEAWWRRIMQTPA